MRRAYVALAVLLATQSATAAPRFSPSAAWKHLEAQVGFGPRVPGTSAHERALAYLVAQLRRTRAHVVTEPFGITDGERRLAMTNVVATFAAGAGDPAVVAAHWDSRPRSEEDPHPAHRHLATPGANDGASGVAVILEVARVLGEQPPPREVRLVLLDGEDWGTRLDTMFYGSREYVARHARELPTWGLLLDMVGQPNLRIPQERFSMRSAPAVVRRIHALAERLGVGRNFPAVEGGEIYDDHLAFLDAGVPMVDLIDFDYAPWHTVHDLPRECSPESLRVVGEVVLGVLRVR